MTFGLIYPIVLGTYKQADKKPVVKLRGYRFSADTKRAKVYDDELVAHIRWLGKTKPVLEIAAIFPHIPVPYVRRILNGEARGKVDARPSMRYSR